MSNLSPEKRLDKNGHLVTRHVRTGTTAPGAGRIPGPQISPRDVEADRQLVIFASPKYRPIFMEQVKQAPQEIVHQLNAFYEKNKGSRSITREVADHTIKIVESANKTKDAPRYIELLSAHFELLSSMGRLGGDGISLINGLIDVQDRVRKNKGTMTVHQQQALIRVTEAMIYKNPTVDRMNDVELRIRNDMEHLVLSDSDLINLVVERPDDADAIAAMVANGVTRAGQIKGVLDDDIQHPLLGGAL